MRAQPDTWPRFRSNLFVCLSLVQQQQQTQTERLTSETARQLLQNIHYIWAGRDH